jgi:SAM-dependent methyltransferase
VSGDSRKKPFDRWVGEVIARESPTLGLSLDVGCGSGRYHGYYRNRVIGVDLRRGAAPSVVSDAVRLPFRDACFRFVTAFQCIYYLENVRSSLVEILRVLQPDGAALVSVSSPVHLWSVQLMHHRIPQRHARRGWRRIFRQAGCLASPVDMPARYTGASWIRGRGGAWLSPYRFYRLERA